MSVGNKRRRDSLQPRGVLARVANTRAQGGRSRSTCSCARQPQRAAPVGARRLLAPAREAQPRRAVWWPRFSMQLRLPAARLTGEGAGMGTQTTRLPRPDAARKTEEGGGSRTAATLTAVVSSKKERKEEQQLS